MQDRRKSRELALQFLFSEEFNKPSDLSKNLKIFKENFSVEPQIFEYTRDLVEGVSQHLNEIDLVIEKHLKNWKMDRLSNVDKNIIRLAVYEISFKKEPLPFKASINEALEISKKFGGTDSSKFINGILDQIAKNTNA